MSMQCRSSSQQKSSRTFAVIHYSVLSTGTRASWGYRQGGALTSTMNDYCVRKAYFPLCSLDIEGDRIITRIRGR